MPQVLGGAGQGLQIPQSLYPANLLNSPVTTSTNLLNLAPGDAIAIPAGRWYISLGKYNSLQYLDPVTNFWTGLRGGDSPGTPLQIWSDGFNVRIANLTGCAIGAVVTNGGSGYTQATTTVNPSAGNSTWQAVVGGAVNTTVSITSVAVVGIGGKGYGIAPFVFFDAPPSGGVPATGVATISGGSVTSITVTDQGAGYLVAPNITIVPSPYDPNFLAGAVTNALATCSLTGAGSVTAIICTNPGAPVATTMTLTVAGSGTSAAATPLFLETLTSVTVVSGGGGYGTFTNITTIGGGVTATPAFTNPTIQFLGYVPRPAVVSTVLTGTAVTSISTIVDGGMFLSAPAPVPMTNGIVSTVASLTAVLGGSNSSARIQQLA